MLAFMHMQVEYEVYTNVKAGRHLTDIVLSQPAMTVRHLKRELLTRPSWRMIKYLGRG